MSRQFKTGRGALVEGNNSKSGTMATKPECRGQHVINIDYYSFHVLTIQKYALTSTVNTSRGSSRARMCVLVCAFAFICSGLYCSFSHCEPHIRTPSPMSSIIVNSAVNSMCNLTTTTTITTTTENNEPMKLKTVQQVVLHILVLTMFIVFLALWLVHHVFCSSL